MYKVVDLFAGAGGLSLGFLQTGKYDIKVAFENSPHMQDTYRLNHPGVDVRGDVCEANYLEIQKEYGEIDVVIGGPPCQGFSNANRQKNTAINQNNMLVKQYIRAILELQPKAFVMENVSMLKSDVHRFYLDKNDISVLEKYSIPVKDTALVLLDRTLMYPGVESYLEDEALIDRDLWSDDQYAKLNVVFKATKNTQKIMVALKKHEKILRKYASDISVSISDTPIGEASKSAFDAIIKFYDGNLEVEEIGRSIEPAIMYQRMLSKLKEIFSNNLVVDRWETKNDLTAIIRSYAVYDYLKAILEEEYNLNASVMNAADYGAPQKRMRFVVIGLKKVLCNKVELPNVQFEPEAYRTVREAIADIETVPTVVDLRDDIGIKLDSVKEISDLGKLLRDSKVLRNHIITKTRDVAMERFRSLKQGQNFHSLDKALQTNTYTDVTRTQNTIYLRLNYDEPSGTVINVRKSMWIHPTLDRAISVREAARLQTFPDSFVFCGSKDKQYQQVGNAVPPIMAKAIAEKLAKQLKKGLGKEVNSLII